MTPNSKDKPNNQTKDQLDQDIAEQDAAIERNHAGGLREMERTGKYTIQPPSQEEYNRSERIHKNSHDVYPGE